MRNYCTAAAFIVLTAALAGCTHHVAGQGRFPGREVDLPLSKVDLQSLLDRARDGATVQPPLGRYVLSRPLTIAQRKNLHIAFAPGTQVRVASTDLNVIEVTDCQAVRISGCRARHVAPLAEYNCHGAVLRIHNSKGVQIDNCELNGCGAIGITANGVQELAVTNCHIHHNTFNGLYLNACDEVSIVGSIIEDNANSVTTYKCGEVIMSDNLIQRNGGYWQKARSPGLTRTTQPG